jgi:quercetin dioxygenase-like cupin family protein
MKGLAQSTGCIFSHCHKFALALLAGDDPDGAVETLLETQTTNIGKAIAYPSGAAQITAVIVTLAPGGETGRHRHPVPLYGQVLSGELTVDYGEHGSKTYQAGDAFIEAMNTWHNGRNTGDGPLRILAVYMGADNVPNVVRP